jgi:hypothetical protein
MWFDAACEGIRDTKQKAERRRKRGEENSEDIGTSRNTYKNTAVASSSHFFCCC